jgi:hypothetical protein
MDKKMDLQNIIDRLQQSPYNCRFDEDRKIGEGFIIKQQVQPYEGGPVATLAGPVVLSGDELFVAKFEECHVYTGAKGDYIIESDIAKWGLFNGCRLNQSSIQKQLIRNKYVPMGMTCARHRVPVPNKTENQSRPLFIGLKRLFWRADGAKPAEDVIAKDLNASLASDEGNQGDEV